METRIKIRAFKENIETNFKKEAYQKRSLLRKKKIDQVLLLKRLKAQRKDLAAKHHELMGSEAVILLYPTTVSIAHFLSLSLVPYTVLPVVFIGEATPG